MSHTSEPPVHLLQTIKLSGAFVMDALTGSRRSKPSPLIARSRKFPWRPRQTDEPRVTETVTGRIQQAYEKGISEHCSLLEGRGIAAVATRRFGERAAKDHDSTSGRGHYHCACHLPDGAEILALADLPWPKLFRATSNFSRSPIH